MFSMTLFGKIGLAGCLGLVGAIALGMGDRAVAQSIIPDTTLGSESSRVNPAPPGVPVDQISGGAIRDSNLFHSFQKFNIDAGREAFFQSSAGIKNIVTRVTGNERSNIFGRLRVSGNANLFLINPNGISFGPNAILNLGGSFVATTANAIGFGDRGFFSASNPEAPAAILTVDPSALLFNQISAQSITNRSQAGLRVPSDRSLLLVGGDVELTGGKLIAPRGRIELAGVASAGVVGLQTEGNQLRLRIPDNVTRANISLSEKAMVEASNGGSIQVQGSQVSVRDGSQISAATFGGEKGGNLLVIATESVELFGTDADANPSGLFTTSTEGSSGNAGDLTIQTGTLIVQNGAQVSASTLGAGQGGKLFVNSQSIKLSGTSRTGNPSALFTVAKDSTGSAGELTIQTGKLIVEDGAQVSASTFGNGQGRGGMLFINASEFIQLVGTSTNNEGSGLRVGTSNSGASGDIKIDTPKLIVQQGAIISARTLAQGEGGNLTINTGELIVQDRGQVSVSSEGGSKAGNIEVTARSIRLDNQGTITTETKSGEGGDITLKARDIVLRNNSNITATAGTDNAGGNGGNIKIDTDVLVSAKNSDITANAFEGKGGNIRINTQGLFLSPDSDITASSERGIAGVVEINTPDIDPTSGLVNLPEAPPADTRVAQGCQASGNQQQNQFIITGRGGLPPSPYEILTPDAVQVDWLTFKPERENRKNANVTSTTTATPKTIVEATGWVVNAKGEVVLIAYAPTLTPHSSWQTSPKCDAKS
jgi:filamentous hemagglutinin family protein